MPPKRPNPNVFGDEDGDGDSPKRARVAAAAGAAPKAASASSAAAASAAAVGDTKAQIEAARARIQATLAAMKKPGVATAVGPSSIPQKPSLEMVGPGVASSSASTSASGVGSAGPPKDLAAMIAEAKRRATLAASKAGVSVPTASMASVGPSGGSSLSQDARPSGIHPLLAGRMGAASSNAAVAAAAAAQQQLRSMAPKFSTLRANQQSGASASASASSSRGGRIPGFDASTASTNPYLAHQALVTEDPSGPSTTTSEAAPGPKNRSMHRSMQFHRAGRHINAAEEARKEAQAEEMKRRIQLAARKAGLEDGSEARNLRRPPPPAVEWWDLAFLPEGAKGYDDLLLTGDDSAGTEDPPRQPPLLTGENTPIDNLVQHPIPIPAPSDKSAAVQPRGVMLTKREMKKMRKQRRHAEHEDKRDRIKMGLLPPDPPKVKLSNLMRVLTSEAVADPTKVEARIRREISARREKHERINLENKLSVEQRAEKVLEKKEREEAKGISVTVYKVRHLISPSHKFKVRRNARDHGLTGMTLFHPNFALVVVEGGAKGLKAYRNLMMNRIDWTDPGRPRDDVDPSRVEDAEDGGSGPVRKFINDPAEYADVDFSENTCELVFEGPLRDRIWPGGFRARRCETDGDAKEALGEKMAGFWDVAKRWKDSVAEQ